MKYEQIVNNILLREYDSFHIGQTLECGQCFRFQKLDEGAYEVIAFSQVLHIKQTASTTEFSYPHKKLTVREFEEIWIPYFDLKRDYRIVKEVIADNDNVLRDAVEYAPGIRILRQDPWEAIVSFIISQNNHIPRIKRIIQNISEAYGAKIGGSACCSFPAAAQLQAADIPALMACNTGFRAKYILDVVEKALSHKIELRRDSALETEALKKNLLTVKGIGTKVADCVLLFGFGRYEYFPTDVWVKRIMQHFYFGGAEASVEEIHQLAYKKFGAYAGFAQQYLFHYARQYSDIFK